MFFGVNFKPGHGQEVNGAKLLVCVSPGPNQRVIIKTQGAMTALFVARQRRVSVALYLAYQFFCENIPLPVLEENRFRKESELVHGSGPVLIK